MSVAGLNSLTSVYWNIKHVVSQTRCVCVCVCVCTVGVWGKSFGWNRNNGETNHCQF